MILSFINIRKVAREMLKTSVLMNGKSCLIPILKTDHIVVFNVENLSGSHFNIYEGCSGSSWNLVIKC